MENNRIPREKNEKSWCKGLVNSISSNVFPPFSWKKTNHRRLNGGVPQFFLWNFLPSILGEDVAAILTVAVFFQVGLVQNHQLVGFWGRLFFLSKKIEAQQRQNAVTVTGWWFQIFFIFIPI